VAGHAFLSYIREDKASVDQLQLVLEAAGIPVWRDIRDLQPGQDWKLSIRRAISEDALAFVACFSRAGQVKPKSYQNEELLLAVDQFRRRAHGQPWLIPVRFDDCDVPDLDLGAGRTLGSLQRADLFGDTRADHTARLVRTIGQILGRNPDAAARGESAASGLRPYAGTKAAGEEPARLGEVILSTVIQRPMNISELIGRRIATAARQENRTGWYLPEMGGPRFLADEAWPIRHHSHHVGYLLWTRDSTGWEIAMPDGRWLDEGQDEFDGSMHEWPYRYLGAPPAHRAQGCGRKWADPADLLLALAEWHYCPRTAVATLFRLVEQGVSPDEASHVIHLVPAVGERIVRRAQRVSNASGLPFQKQVDDFLPIRESDWKAGII
jgi:hypothetical protein